MWVKAEEFWNDYPNIQNTWGNLSNKVEFLNNVNGIANFMLKTLKFAWAVAFFISIIALVMSITSMVIHSDDNPILKDHAKHDIFAALASIGVLSSIGLIYTIIVALIF